MQSSEGLINLYKQNSDPENAAKQEDYLKNQFKFFGIPASKRRKLSKPTLDFYMYLTKDRVKKSKRIPPVDFEELRKLWELPQREIHYFVIDYIIKAAKFLREVDIPNLDYFFNNKQWWDSIDNLAPVYAILADRNLNNDPESPNNLTLKIEHKMFNWATSENIWERRTAIIFQNHRKENTNTALFEKIILLNCEDKDFFIRKAIGWALREYSKINPQWVIDFVNTYDDKLHSMTKKEALRLVTQD